MPPFHSKNMISMTYKRKHPDSRKNYGSFCTASTSRGVRVMSVGNATLELILISWYWRSSSIASTPMLLFSRTVTFELGWLTHSVMDPSSQIQVRQLISEHPTMPVQGMVTMIIIQETPKQAILMTFSIFIGPTI